MENIEKFAEYCKNNLNLNDEHYAEAYKSLGPAILDCIYSLRAKYFAVTVPVVERYADKYMNGDRHAAGYDLNDFISHIEDAGGYKDFAINVVHNLQEIGGRLKSEICLDVANVLIKSNILTIEDFAATDPEILEFRLRKVKGMGDAAVNYMFMLAGDPNRCKPDVHIHNCIKDALGHYVSNEECQELFKGAVLILKEINPKMTVKLLDGLIWQKYQAKK